ncbi:MAG: 50S ribosomal protein L9 [Actinomycetota bacterium]
MKIILHKPVETLGEAGEIVQVKDGYARNYLFPRGLAAPATKGAVKHAERVKAQAEERVRKGQEEAESTAARLAKAPVRMQAQAGEDGKLFGSITAHHISEQIEGQLGEKVDHRDIKLDEPIRSLGVHSVKVHLHPEVDASVTVDVVAG